MCSRLLFMVGCLSHLVSATSMPSSMFLPTTTVLDTTPHDNSCSCKMVILRPLSFSAHTKEVCLHITLCGHGTRSLARQATNLLGKSLDRERASMCHCVVEMSESRGASVSSLPIVARFMVARRRQLKHVSVLHARGLSLQAVRIVSRLSGKKSIQFYRSLAHLEAADDGSTRHRLFVQAAQKATAKARRARRWPHKWPSKPDFMR
jgi:hypothetical protein